MITMSTILGSLGVEYIHITYQQRSTVLLRLYETSKCHFLYLKYTLVNFLLWPPLHLGWFSSITFANYAVSILFELKFGRYIAGGIIDGIYQLRSTCHCACCCPRLSLQASFASCKICSLPWKGLCCPLFCDWRYCCCASSPCSGISNHQEGLCFFPYLKSLT